MKIEKSSNLEKELVDLEAELPYINRYALEPLTVEEIYAFPVRLCDNAVDRDCEAFTFQSLHKLASLFEGKPGIFDHQWSAIGQTARIYRTEVVTAVGEGVAATIQEKYCYLRGWAYIVRTPDTERVISLIRGGILREVSVGCSAQKCVCSVCGNELHTSECRHRKGEMYNGEKCIGLLTGITDAYEWSFVAVPAQPKAGVGKSFSSANDNNVSDSDKVAIEKMRFGGM